MDVLCGDPTVLQVVDELQSDSVGEGGLNVKEKCSRYFTCSPGILFFLIQSGASAGSATELSGGEQVVFFGKEGNVGHHKH